MSLDDMALLMSNSAMGSPSQPMFSGSISSNRSSVSTTKSALRASNALLLEMLQNLQTELFAHRSIMLEIQSRVSQLEQRRSSMTSCTEVEAVEPNSTSNGDMKAPVNTERIEWWRACQNFAQNSNPPLSASEFLRTPRPLSAVVKHPSWEKRISCQASIVPETPPSTPPPEKAMDVEVHEAQIEQIGEVAKAKLVEIEVRELPPPPVLHSVPVAKALGKKEKLEEEDHLELSPPITNATLDSAVKQTRFRAAYKAHFKHKKTEKEHVVLIQFHRLADFKERA